MTDAIGPWEIISAVLDDRINIFFFVLIAVLAVAAVACSPSEGGRRQTFARAAPGILTSLGVLGTFVGIFIGLMGFDVANIDDSVPNLLQGLKVAFATSIFGMGSGILVKFFHGWLVPRAEQGGDEITGKELLTALGGIKSAVDQVRGAIVGEGDSSLVTQVQKLRTDIQDGNRDTVEELRSFGRQLAESNAKLFIDALRETIADFNTKLSEQFGENFKKLNDAVGKLLEWQERYREHVETLEGRFEAALSGIEASRSAVAEIAAKTGTIPTSMQTLDEVLRSLRAGNDDLQAKLEAFASMRQQALDAFPQIEKRLEDLTTGFSGVVLRTLEAGETSLTAQQKRLDQVSTSLTAAVEKNIEDIRVAVDKQEQALTNLSDRYVALQDKASEVVATVGREIQVTLAGLESTVTGFVQAQEKNLVDITASTTQHIGAVVEQQRQWSQEIQAGFDKLKDETAEIIDRIELELERAFQRLSQEMQKAADAQAHQIRNLAERQMESNSMVVEEMRKQFSESMKKTETVLLDAVAQFDRAMQEEMTRQIEVMGSHLASLSGKFVEDYTPLTDRLRDLVKTAERVQA